MKQPVHEEVSAPITKGNLAKPFEIDNDQVDLFDNDSIFGDNDQLARRAIDVHFERDLNYRKETSSIYQPDQDIKVLEPQGNSAQINIK